MNRKSINRTVLAALTLTLCLGLIAYSPFSAQATDPQKTPPAEPMSAKACDCRWTIGTHSTNWIYLGQVSGVFVNKKEACKKLALAACQRAEVINLVKANVPASQACPGGVNVDFDTRVEDRINSRDGTCRVVPGCVCSAWSYK